MRLLSHVLVRATLVAVCSSVCGNNGPAVCPSATAAGVALHLCLAATPLLSKTYTHTHTTPIPPLPPPSIFYHTPQSTLVLNLHPALAFSASLQRTMQIQQAYNVAPLCRLFLFNIKFIWKVSVILLLVSLHEPNPIENKVKSRWYMKPWGKSGQGSSYILGVQ